MYGFDVLITDDLQPQILEVQVIIIPRDYYFMIEKKFNHFYTNDYSY